MCSGNIAALMLQEHVAPAALRQRLWSELERAPHDRHHDWRTPVLATVGLDGLPQARTVVLREARASTQELVFFTDARSPKCAQLRSSPGALLLFWSPRLRWQLRVSGHARVQSEGPEVQATWERVRSSPSARDYQALQPPGTPLLDAGEPAGEGLPTSRHHLARVSLAVQRLDWLELARDGHRRAMLEGDELRWCMP
jgi:pyridoxamine 5'-phosphate oxidase